MLVLTVRSHRYEKFSLLTALPSLLEFSPFEVIRDLAPFSTVSLLERLVKWWLKEFWRLHSTKVIET